MSPDPVQGPRQLPRLGVVVAGTLVLALLLGVAFGDGARLWGYVAAGAMTLALAGVAAARLARRQAAADR